MVNVHSSDTRYFVVTFGRSGSSLLSHVLQRSGATFNLPHSKEVNTYSEHLENPVIDLAIKAADAANRCNRNDPLRIGRIRFNLWRSIAKRRLGKALSRAVYSKSRGNTLVIPLAPSVGYDPKLIVMYRNFGDVLISDIEKSKNVPSYYAAQLERTFSDAQFLLNRFGGLIIDFDDLVDVKRQAWIEPLAELTGLDAALIARTRSELVRENFTKPQKEVVVPRPLREVEAFYRNNVNTVFHGMR